MSSCRRSARASRALRIARWSSRPRLHRKSTRPSQAKSSPRTTNSPSSRSASMSRPTAAAGCSRSGSPTSPSSASSSRATLTPSRRAYERRFLFCPPDKGGSERLLRAGGLLFSARKTNPPLAFGSRPPCQGVKAMSDLDDLLNKGEFAGRHLGSDEATQRQMLDALKVQSLDALVREVVPAGILLRQPLALGEAMREPEALAELSKHAMRNEVWRSFIGMGYHGTHTPAVIQRNVLENLGWYTAYTPYQAEISQGRLEGLLNFQQMVIDLTGLPVANASLLDEATAAAEAMAMIRRSARSKATAFFVDSAVHPQVLSVMRTRAKWLGIELVVGDDMQPDKVFGAHLQYPDTFGRIRDFSELIGKIHAAEGLVSMGTDLLALMLLRSPGAMGADVAIGSAQRFGVPMGFGGPHAAFMACRDEYKRSMPGRIIGVSVDAAGRPALRMALQTREQHIRRDKATSNICTAQALL